MRKRVIIIIILKTEEKCKYMSNTLLSVKIKNKEILFILKEGHNSIGRYNSDCMITQPAISRNHAIIIYEEKNNTFKIKDCNSTNGTMLVDESGVNIIFSHIIF